MSLPRSPPTGKNAGPYRTRKSVCLSPCPPHGGATWICRLPRPHWGFHRRSRWLVKLRGCRPPYFSSRDYDAACTCPNCRGSQYPAPRNRSHRLPGRTAARRRSFGTKLCSRLRLRTEYLRRKIKEVLMSPPPSFPPLRPSGRPSSFAVLTLS